MVTWHIIIIISSLLPGLVNPHPSFPYHFDIIVSPAHWLPVYVLYFLWGPTQAPSTPSVVSSTAYICINYLVSYNAVSYTMSTKAIILTPGHYQNTQTRSNLKKYWKSNLRPPHNAHNANRLVTEVAVLQ